MTDTRLVPLENTSTALSWPIKLDEPDYFDAKRIILNFGAPITTEENLTVKLQSGLGPLYEFPLLSIPLRGKTGVMLEDIATLMRKDTLLIEFPNTGLVTIDGYAALERTKQNTGSMATVSRVSFPNYDGIVVPREANGGVPVNVQDQTSPLLDLYFTQQVGTVTTVSTNVVLPTRDVTLTSVAGFIVGSYLGLFSGVSGENRYYFGEVLAINSNTLTMDTPLNFEFTASDPAVRLSRELNVDGSTVPKPFIIQGGGTGSLLEVDITKIKLIMTCASPVDLSKFGDLASLTKGLTLRRVDGTYTNYWNIKNNAQFDLFGEWTPYAATNPAQGIDGMRFVYQVAGQENHGVTSRLAANEFLELCVQDNLLGLTSLRAIAQGHEVTD
jgi:hypothetical protein